MLSITNYIRFIYRLFLICSLYFPIYNEYNELMTIDGQSKTLVTEHLMKKYGIHSQGTIYLIRRRVEEKLKSREGNNGK